MGGLTAEHVAVLHPGRVTRLVLAATGPGRHAAVPAAPEATVFEGNGKNGGARPARDYDGAGDDYGHGRVDR